MAGHDEREPVPCAEGAGGALCVRASRERGELAVGDGLAGRHVPQRSGERPLKGGRAVEVELDVEEVIRAAPEISGDPRRERMTRAVTARPGARQLVQQEALAVEPHLPHAPAVDLVPHVSGRHCRNRRINTVSAPGIFRPPKPANEPVKDYAPGSPERTEVRRRLDQMQNDRIEAPLVIGGEDVTTGETAEAVMPHRKSHVLADVHQGGPKEVERAIDAAGEAWHDWSRLPWEERASVFLRAAELLAGASESEIADAIYQFGEERFSRRVARAIVQNRETATIRTTGQLAAIVRHAIPRRGFSRIDPATRTFQGLRIWVNRELERLDDFIAAAAARLKTGARMVLITFHSLEDRIVKHTLRALAQREHAQIRILTKKPVLTRPDEVEHNPRARSAKLRAAERVA